MNKNFKNMIKKRILLLWLITIIGLSLQAQRVLTGSVKNKNDNSEVSTATIMIVGTTIGTKSDGNGNYKLIVPESIKGTFKLKASYLGLKNSIISVAPGTDKVDFTLEDDKLKLDEVVVTALAIKREKRSLGYGTVTVKGDDLNQAGASSALTGLQGKTTGASIVNSGGTPGSSTSIILRGQKSFTGNNQALIVVDGVPINNSSFQNSDNLNNSVDFGNRLNDLNPNDIENVTILKGAEGAAIYGSLAVNGVVIITTKSAKKAKKGKDLAITFNSNYKLQNPLKLPDLQTQFGQGGNGNYDSRENWSWGPKLDGITRPWGNPVMLADENGNLVSKIKVKPFSGIKDNLRNGFDQGYTFTNDISLQKAFENINFYFSYQNQDVKGIIPTTGLTKNSFRLNTGLDLMDNFNIQLNTNYTNTKIDNSVQGQANSSFYDNLLQIPVDVPISELRDLNDPFNNITNYYNAYAYNPYQMINYNNAGNNVDRFNISGTFTYNPLSWLTLTERFGWDNYTDSRYFKENKFTNTNQHPSATSEQGKYQEEVRTNTLFNNDFIASISRNINKDVDYTARLGFNIFDNTLKRNSASTSGLAIPNVYNLNNSDGRPANESGETNTLRYGVYGGLDVDYKNMLFVGITGRQDWSSTLPVQKRSYFYPSINSSFVFTELMKDKILTFGKIRASWSQIGKDAQPNSLNTVFNPGLVTDGFNTSEVKSPYVGSDGTSTVAGYSQSNAAGNPDLRPEMITSWEVGTELGFFNERIYLDLALYNSTTTDGIIQVDVAPSTGFTSKYINAGRMTNTGYEIGLKFVPILKNNLKLEGFVNFTQNENTVTEVYPGVKRLSLGGVSGASVYVDEGSPYGVFYANGYDRSPDGQMVVDASSGLPVFSGNLVKMGSYMPDYTLAFGASATIYKRWRANILFDYKKGGVFYSRTKDLVEFLGSGSTTTINNREDYVIPNTVNLVGGQYVTNTTAAFVQDWMTQQSDAENNIIDATFLKLREVSLYYTMPLSAKFSKYVKGIELGIFGNNLFIWTPASNSFVDPEINSFGTGNTQGIDFSNIPSLRAVGANLKLTF